MNLRLMNDIETIAWDARASELLAGENADKEIRDRKAVATAKGLAAVFFMPHEIAEQVTNLAQYEVSSGAAEKAVHIPLLNGGVPFHDDKIDAIHLINPAIDVKTGKVRTTAYDGPTYVGAHVIPEECELDILTPDSEAVFDDDGIETASSIIVSAQHLLERCGVTKFSCRTALTKQPGMTISGFSRTIALFSTPFGVWGEGYGFDNNGTNRDEDIIGVSMTQSPDNFDVVEFTLNKLGGTDGFAVASMDDVVRFNRERLS